MSGYARKIKRNKRNTCETCGRKLPRNYRCGQCARCRPVPELPYWLAAIWHRLPRVAELEQRAVLGIPLFDRSDRKDVTP